MRSAGFDAGASALLVSALAAFIGETVPGLKLTDLLGVDSFSFVTPNVVEPNPVKPERLDEPLSFSGLKLKSDDFDGVVVAAAGVLVLAPNPPKPAAPNGLKTGTAEPADLSSDFDAPPPAEAAAAISSSHEV